MHNYHVAPHQFILTLTTLQLYAAHKVFCQLQILTLRFKLNDNCDIFIKTHEACPHLLHVSVLLCVEDERNCPRKKECEPGSKCHQQCVTLANGTDACSCHSGYTINSDGYRYVDTTLLHVAMPVTTEV